MLAQIGDGLGKFCDFKITHSTVLIRVEINGLKPFIKTTIIDFGEGQKATILLEYEGLKNHCDICHRLSHDDANCDMKTLGALGTRAIQDGVDVPSGSGSKIHSASSQADFRRDRDFSQRLSNSRRDPKRRYPSLPEHRRGAIAGVALSHNRDLPQITTSKITQPRRNFLLQQTHQHDIAFQRTGWKNLPCSSRKFAEQALHRQSSNTKWIQEWRQGIVVRSTRSNEDANCHQIRSPPLCHPQPEDDHSPAIEDSQPVELGRDSSPPYAKKRPISNATTPTSRRMRFETTKHETNQLDPPEDAAPVALPIKETVPKTQESETIPKKRDCSYLASKLGHISPILLLSRGPAKNRIRGIPHSPRPSAQRQIHLPLKLRDDGAGTSRSHRKKTSIRTSPQQPLPPSTGGASPSVELQPPIVQAAGTKKTVCKGW